MSDETGPRRLSFLSSRPWVSTGSCCFCLFFFEFFSGLGAVLLTLHLIRVLSEPALWVYWQVKDEAIFMRLAASIKQYCVDDLKPGRSVYERVGNSLDAKP